MTARPDDPTGSLLATLAEAGQPERLYKALEEATRSLVGHKLFTLLYVDGQDVARVYSSRPAEYPISGRKTMGETPWGELVLKRRQPFLGRDRQGIRWAFFDHVLIESMGLGSVINIPVLYDGQAIGTMNLLDVEHHYADADVAPVARLAPLLIPAFLEARAAARATDRNQIR
ncbi:GAF domain-containing protein [Phreatobacter sp. AB_2022a]|uniref:GAF domain-containing protein n=1 Tax=Phreatobacter sp. AB_2022a TaxID=3003134 RepID=UPI0022875132|nr:GAF domain-containing protein [Phreatobacter sp. AB_2022a]MCZ0732639.1 GAF domain-containing protein [Phreatobacter sp. AB_2022a]